MYSTDLLNSAGIAICVVLASRLVRARRAVTHGRRMPVYGYVGAVIVVAGEALTLSRVEPVATYFTPIAWTGYILWADAAVCSIRGRSLLKNAPAEFAGLALSSIPLWLLFEAYNLRLQNWIYVGVPQNWFARNFGYAWAFATIWPGILETAALLRALRGHPQEEEANTLSETGGHVSSSILDISIGAGAVMVIAPVAVPVWLGSYLFGAVWLGFIFLLEPINYRTGRASLLKDIERGDWSRVVALLASGIICGVFWEFWNYWASGRWLYIFPILPRWRIFAMPLPGYAGFPPFALECFVLFALVAPWISSARKAFGRRKDFRKDCDDLRWEILKL